MSIQSLSSAVVLLMAVGCAGPSSNKGYTPTRPLDQRDSSERGLASKDLTTATDDMAAQIAALPGIRKSEYRTVVVVDRVLNRTSQPNKDFDIYIHRIRARLNSSGARRNIGFVLRRSEVEAGRAREGIGGTQRSEFEDPDAPSPGGGYSSKARYMLRGEFFDSQSGDTNTYFMSFQLVRFSDGEMIWEGSYEVKF